MRRMRFRTIATLGVTAALPFAVGVPSALAGHDGDGTGFSLAPTTVELFDVSAGGTGGSVTVPFSVSVAGQKIFGPAEQGYKIPNRVDVPAAAAGGSIVGGLTGHVEDPDGPSATACPNGKPGQQFSVATHGGFVTFDVAFVGTGLLAPQSTAISEPIPVEDSGDTVQVNVCRN